MIAGYKTLAVEVVNGVLETGASRGDTAEGGRHGRQGDGRRTDDDEGGEKE